MKATLTTRGHGVSGRCVRCTSGILLKALVAALAVESRIAVIVLTVGLAGFAAWVGMAHSTYTVDAESVSFEGGLRSTTLRKADIHAYSWERDDYNIEELTIRARQGRAISLSRSDLARNPDFDRALQTFLAA